MIAEMIQGTRIQQTMCKPWGKTKAQFPCRTAYISLHFLLMFMVNVGKYAIHGSYGSFWCFCWKDPG